MVLRSAINSKNANGNLVILRDRLVVCGILSKTTVWDVSGVFAGVVDVGRNKWIPAPEIHGPPPPTDLSLNVNLIIEQNFIAWGPDSYVSNLSHTDFVETRHRTYVPVS